MHASAAPRLARIPGLPGGSLSLGSVSGLCFLRLRQVNPRHGWSGTGRRAWRQCAVVARMWARVVEQSGWCMFVWRRGGAGAVMWLRRAAAAPWGCEARFAGLQQQGQGWGTRRLLRSSCTCQCSPAAGRSGAVGCHHAAVHPLLQPRCCSTGPSEEPCLGLCGRVCLGALFRPATCQIWVCAVGGANNNYWARSALYGPAQAPMKPTAPRVCALHACQGKSRSGGMSHLAKSFSRPGGPRASSAGPQGRGTCHGRRTCAAATTGICFRGSARGIAGRRA